MQITFCALGSGENPRDTDACSMQNLIVQSWTAAAVCFGRGSSSSAVCISRRAVYSWDGTGRLLSHIEIRALFSIDPGHKLLLKRAQRPYCVSCERTISQCPRTPRLLSLRRLSLGVNRLTPLHYFSAHAKRATSWTRDGVDLDDTLHSREKVPRGWLPRNT